MATRIDDDKPLHELLYQALETEAGTIEVYEAALRCVQNEDLKQDWEAVLEQTRTHHRVVLGLLDELGLSATTKTAGRDVVGHLGRSLVRAMQMARAPAPGPASERVACECVLLAETRNHQNWEVIGHVAERLSGPTANALRQAHAAVRNDKVRHLFRSQGWARERWMASLGFPALPPDGRR